MNSLGWTPLACGPCLDLLVLHLAAGIGDVDRAVDEGGDARAGATAGDRDGEVGVDLSL